MMTLLEAIRQGIIPDWRIEQIIEWSLPAKGALRVLTERIRKTKPNFSAIPTKEKGDDREHDDRQ